VFECHLSLGRDVTALQCVCFIVSCMSFDNVQMVKHCNVFLSLCMLYLSLSEGNKASYISCVYVVLVFPPRRWHTLLFTLFRIVHTRVIVTQLNMFYFKKKKFFFLKVFWLDMGLFGWVQVGFVEYGYVFVGYGFVLVR